MNNKQVSAWMSVAGDWQVTAARLSFRPCVMERRVRQRVRLRRRHRQALWCTRACACRGCRGGSARTTTMVALQPWANEKHCYLLAVFMCWPLRAPRCLLFMSRVLQQRASLRYRNIGWHAAQRWHNIVMYLERVRARTRTIWDDRPLPLQHSNNYVPLSG